MWIGKMWWNSQHQNSLSDMEIQKVQFQDVKVNSWMPVHVLSGCKEFLSRSMLRIEWTCLRFPTESMVQPFQSFSHPSCIDRALSRLQLKQVRFPEWLGSVKVDQAEERGTSSVGWHYMDQSLRPTTRQQDKFYQVITLIVLMFYLVVCCDSNWKDVSC